MPHRSATTSLSAQFRYQDLNKEVRQLVSGLASGSKLPSERALADMFRCTPLIVRRALLPLVAEGAITRRVGSGTFVAAGSHAPFLTGKTRIGVLLPQNEDTYAHQVLQALVYAASVAGVELSSTWIADFSADRLSRVRTLANEGCQACILPWVPADTISQVRAFTEACPIPVILPLVIPGLEQLCFERQDVFGSHAIAATNAVLRFFQQQGNRRIAFLGPDTPTDRILQKKISAYVCHLSREKLPSLCGLIQKDARSMDQLALQWACYRGELAIIAYDDEHAVRLITAMHKLGLSAPTDYWIIGFNNTEASRYSDPPLSTVCQNFGYIGHSLIKSALASAEGKSWQSSETPPTRLILRGTSGSALLINDAMRTALPDIDFISEEAAAFSATTHALRPTLSAISA